jgi:AcrR family transcriptional regulator
MLVMAKKSTGTMGRPRSFDETAALDAAMRVFWQRGYEGASMAELSAAMKMSPPSIYAAFGNKESLFIRAINYYLEGPASYEVKALQEPTLEKVLHALFVEIIAFLTSPSNPPGCMTLGALSCSADAVLIQTRLTAIRKKSEARLAKRMTQAQRDGELPEGTTPVEFARYVSTLLGGLTLQRANGASAKDLRRTADLALKHLSY